MTDGTDRTPASTRRRFLTAAGLATSAAVAGCQGGSDGTADGTTGPASEAATTGEQTPTEAQAALGFPEGTSETGIDDPDTLVEATQATLAITDYETTSRLVQSDQTVERSRRSSLDDRRQLQLFRTATETNWTFVADGTAYVRSERDGDVTYEAGESRQSFEDRHRRSRLGEAERLGGILRQGSYTPAETARHNDRPVRSFTLESASVPGDGRRVTDAEGGVLVDADSVVHEALLALELESEPGSETLNRTFTVGGLGSLDVPTPEWVETARQREK